MGICKVIPSGAHFFSNLDIAFSGMYHRNQKTTQKRVLTHMQMCQDALIKVFEEIGTRQ